MRGAGWRSHGRNVLGHWATLELDRVVVMGHGALAAPVVRADHRSLVGVLERRVEAVILKTNVSRVIHDIVIVVIVD